ncbi:NAD(P)H-hydrate dehydratase [Silvimonas iriomotensis]|uniref:Bifunctional NAD(P)H-hydrate repair enzyme n=1 Tax=Silvimonas iriomotensis TaxID=449662 RepID=A0ABQ2PDI2_9NEIS|nr:NAD(P)H-hydrate dehydratase [Silvimonas iriomotensis]GGP23607.1 bifunctional NAD(P)H-hydrate repair enzyme [Silvimonas iriomotensis]
MTHDLYRSKTTRHIEQTQVAAGAQLMVRAGLAAAQWIAARFPQETRVVVLVGPGNNGGDGLTVARHLKEGGYKVRVHYLSGSRAASAPTARALELWHRAGGTLDDAWDENNDLVIDALFGIGLSRDVPEVVSALFTQIEASRQKVIALDIPSGLDADTGAIRGKALHAHTTLTFIGDKPGLHTAEGQDYAGQVLIFNLDIPASAFPPGDLQLYQPDTLPPQLQRHQASHKGSYGTLGILGGAPGMTGAPLLAGRAALRLGAGKVRIGLLGPGLAVDLVAPELMLAPAKDLPGQPHDIWLAGPGLGQSPEAIDLVAELLGRPEPLVLDADGLNLLASQQELARLCTERAIPAVLTPHPAEAARLLGCPTSQVQQDRLFAAQELAQRYQAIIVLKGSGTVVCDSNHASINGSGNAALAAAGQGDILGGIIAALMAQGMAPLDAAKSGVFLHGAGADLWRQEFAAAIGLTASETIDYARKVLNRLPAA